MRKAILCGGDVRVLNGVNVCLEKGFVYTLKGGNGSGKTTLINSCYLSNNIKPLLIDESVAENERNKIDENILKYVINNWLKEMNVPKYEIFSSDLPTNTKKRIENFLTRMPRRYNDVLEKQHNWKIIHTSGSTKLIGLFFYLRAVEVKQPNG